MGRRLFIMKKQSPSNVFEEHLKRKEAGEVLDWKTVTKRELYYMNILEEHTHQQIGELYGVTKNTVREKMGKAGLTVIWKYGLDETIQDIEHLIWKSIRKSKRSDRDFEKYYKILEVIHPDFSEIA